MTRAAQLRRTAILAAGGLLAAVVLAACGSSGQSSTTAQTSSAATTTSSAATSSSLESAAQQNANGNGSFLGHPSNGVIYVEWTNSASGLVGTLYTDLIQQSSGAQGRVDTQSSSLTGTVNGSSISLSVSGGSNMTGTLSGGSLVLDYPGQAGSVIELPMQQASTGDYDQALAALQSEVASANSVTQQQQSAQATAQQVQKDAASVSADIAQIASDTGSAASDGSVLYVSAIQQERQDVAKTQGAMQHVLNEAGSTDINTICSDSYTVQDDVYTVQDDVYTVQNDQGTAANATSSITADLSQLAQDNAMLAADRTNSPTDIPNNAPSASQVQSAMSAAKAVEGQINGASTAAIASAQNLLQQANGYQQQSDAACNG